MCDVYASHRGLKTSPITARRRGLKTTMIKGGVAVINVVICLAILVFVAEFQDRIQPRLWVTITIVSIVNGFYLAKWLTDIAY